MNICPEKVPVALLKPPVVKLAMVGPLLVPKANPRRVMVTPPSSEIFPPLEAVVAVIELPAVVAASSGTKVCPDTQLDVLPFNPKFCRVPFNPVADVRFVRVDCPVLVPPAVFWSKR